MRQLWTGMRFSSVGVMLAGVGSVISGCSAEDAIRALFVLLALALGGGAAEEAATGGGTAAPAIVLFSAGKTITTRGNLGGRIGADGICQGATLPAGVDPATVHAFISVSGSDQLANLPTLPPGFSATLPVVGPPPNLTPIAADWADLFDGDDLLSSFSAAGATTNTGQTEVWTGSFSSGLVHTRTCTGWTVGTTGSNDSNLGQMGDDTSQGANAISVGQRGCGSATTELVCAGSR